MKRHEIVKFMPKLTDELKVMSKKLKKSQILILTNFIKSYSKSLMFSNFKRSLLIINFLVLDLLIIRYCNQCTKMHINAYKSKNVNFVLYTLFQSLTTNNYKEMQLRNIYLLFSTKKFVLFYKFNKLKPIYFSFAYLHGVHHSAFYLFYTARW